MPPTSTFINFIAGLKCLLGKRHNEKIGRWSCKCCQGFQAASSNLSDFNLYKILLLQMRDASESESKLMDTHTSCTKCHVKWGM